MPPPRQEYTFFGKLVIGPQLFFFSESRNINDDKHDKFGYFVHVVAQVSGLVMLVLLN